MLLRDVIFSDLRRNYVATSGIGAFTLGAAVPGFDSIDDVTSPGDSFYYSITHAGNGQHEVGLATVAADGTIERAPVGALIDFQPGAKTLALVAGADWYNAANGLAIDAGTVGQYYRGDKTWQTLDKVAVDLANVDNTSDANKPVSIAQQTALNLRVQFATTRAALAGLNTTAPAILAEAGREGRFKFDSTDISAHVSGGYVYGDTAQAIYVLPSFDTSGASGAWVRVQDAIYARRTFQASWFGAKGDASTDNRPAFQAGGKLLNTLGGGDLELGVGVFGFAATATDDATNTFLRGLPLYQLSNVTIRGSGMGATVLKMLSAGGVQQARLLNIIGCSNVTVRDLIIHGNSDDATFVATTSGLSPALMAGVQVMASDTVTFERVFSIYTLGDAFNLSGTAGQTNSNIKFIDCGHHDNGRDGIAFAGYSWDQVHIVRHYFGPNVAVQQIDCEPLGAGTYRGIYVTDPFVFTTGTDPGDYSFVFAGYVSGTGVVTPATDVIVRGGNIDGTILLQNVEKVLIEGVRRIYSAKTGLGAIVMQFQVQDVIIRDCPYIDWQGSPNSPATSLTSGTIYIVEKASGTPSVRLLPKRITIENCGITGAGQLLYAQDVDRLTVRNNRFYGTTSGLMAAFHAQDSDMLDTRIEGNRFDGTGYAAGSARPVQYIVTGAFLFKSASLLNNRVEGANIDVAFYSGSGTVSCFDVLSCSGNFIPSTAVLFRQSSSQHPHLLLLAGGVGQGSPVFSCKGTPEAAVTASVGAIALRRDGTPGNNAYFKDSGTSNTGWRSLAAPRVQSVASSTTVTPTADNDQVTISALTQNLTLANPSGTPVDGQQMLIRIKDAGTSKTIGYGTQYRAIGVTLPTATTISKTVYLRLVYNSTDTKWDVISVAQEA